MDESVMKPSALEMTSKLEINLIDTVSWLSLLKCKDTLSKMTLGDVLEVLIKDLEVIEDLTKIVSRSQDQLIQTLREEDHYRIRIKKG
jgi:TusA-related sulfurtransferase